MEALYDMQTLTTGTSSATDARAPDSFEQFVALRGLALVRFASRLTGDPYRAEDLVQDALAKAYQRWNRIQRMDQPEVYVRRILVNASHAWWMRRTGWCSMRTWRNTKCQPWPTFHRSCMPR